jgi:hypothetical protein
MGQPRSMEVARSQKYLGNIGSEDVEYLFSHRSVPGHVWHGVCNVHIASVTSFGPSLWLRERTWFSRPSGVSIFLHLASKAKKILKMIYVDAPCTVQWQPGAGVVAVAALSTVALKM